jgi:NADP-dependent 3-hydroxy acid dehydrogenase YdfG
MSESNMQKVLVIVGFGPGTATAVAKKFGSEGFQIALVGRNEERLAAGVAMLQTHGITSFGFQADASRPPSVRDVLKKIRSQMGPITVLHWNAYGMEVPDILNADLTALHRDLDVSVFGLLAATDEVRADMRSNNESAILVSTGGLAAISPQSDEIATQLHMAGLALGSTVKHKLVGLLAQALKPEDIYVGEVTTFSTIRNTPGENSHDSVDPAVIAEQFWELYRSRDEVRATVRSTVHS